MDLERLWRYTSDLHISIGTSGLQGKGSDHDDLRTHDCAVGGACNSSSVFHDPFLVELHNTVHFRGRAGAPHQRVACRAGMYQRGLEAASEGQHGHEYSHRAGNSEHSHDSGCPASTHAAKVVDNGNGHGQTLLIASTTRKRIAVRAGRIPAMTPTTMAKTIPPAIALAGR